MSDRRKKPKPKIMWGYYNFGRLIGVERTRKAARQEVECLTGDIWPVARKYMEVHKVLVAPPNS